MSRWTAHSRRSFVRLGASAAVLAPLLGRAAPDSAAAAQAASSGDPWAGLKVGVATYTPGAVGSGDLADIDTEIPSFFEEEADAAAAAMAARADARAQSVHRDGPNRSQSARENAGRPSTEATWSVCLADGGRRSMRAASTPCTESGTDSRPASASTSTHESPANSSPSTIHAR